MHTLVELMLLILGKGGGNGIEQRPKLTDERVKWSQVASNTGQDDGPLESGDDQKGEILGALEGHP